MPFPRRLARPAVLAIALFGLAACTTSGGAPGAQPTPTPSADVRTIAVLAPLTGDHADEGRGVLAGVQAVIDDRAAELARTGLTVTTLALDDRGEPSVAQQQATRVTDDPSVVAVVGSDTSVVNEGVQPILNTAGLAMVAPGGGAPWLTLRGRPPARPFHTYFRLCALDADQGTAAAIRARGEGDRRAVVVEDGTVEHAGIASAFTAAFSGRPLTSVARVVLPTSDPASIPLSTVRRIAALKPQLVLMSTGPEAVPVLKEALAAVGSRPRVITPMPPTPLTADAGLAKRWTGVLATTIGALPQTLPGAPTIAPPTPADGEAPSLGIYGAAAADAAALVIDALLASPTDTGSVLRADIVASLDAASIDGATGPVRFNRFGDVLSRPIGFFTFDGKTWVPQPAVVVGRGA